MTRGSELVGRDPERERLADAARRAALGQGSLVLVAGEAGVGKTRLAHAVADSCTDARVLRGRATEPLASPYGLIVEALRSSLRADARALAGMGPLQRHLAVILPELGEPAAESDRATLFEAVRSAIAHLSRRCPLLVVLDDLHWADSGTLDLLAGLAEPLDELAVLVVGTYRSDGLARDHPLRRLRNELRRAARFEEIVLDPLLLEETAALVERTLGGVPSAALAHAIHDRTLGVPFFIEELARSLSASGALRETARGLELAAARGEVPLPDTVRDAVLLGLADLPEQARAAANAAAVAGDSFDIDVVAQVAGEAALSDLLARGLVAEDGNGRGVFRHALAREAIYADIPWLRRRALHRAIAEALASAGAPPAETAPHWLGARDGVRARDALAQAASEFEAVHAYRDAASAGRQALELWTDGEDDGRLELLERYACCSELAGDTAEAIRALRELAELRSLRGDGVGVARAERRLAAAHEIKGERNAAFAARRVAAAAFAEHELPDEAARDYLAMANHLRITGKHTEAVEVAKLALEQAQSANSLALRAQALALQGLATAKSGAYEDGLAMVRSSLALALEHGLTPVMPELYQRLSVVLYEAADYRSAADALGTALELCRSDGTPSTEEACVSCLAYVLRDLGDWAEASRTCRELIGTERSVFVAEGLLGSIHAYQGKLSSARRLLNSCQTVAVRTGHYNMTVDSAAALAFVAAAEGKKAEAVGYCDQILARWAESDDRHYALSGLRWSAAYLARSGERRAARECTDALSTVASSSAQPEALAAVAHAIAELALLDGDADTAAAQLANALELHRTIDMPFVRAQIELRAGVALAAAGETELALEHLSGAYRTARKLGARPLAAEAAREATALGDSVVQRLGRAAAAEADGTQLSRREREVVRLLAVGRTNREIAQELFLSPRTVDMHVRNILRKLDCRSRVEAATRATELGLVA